MNANSMIKITIRRFTKFLTAGLITTAFLFAWLSSVTECHARNWAIVIGTSKYADKHFQELDFVEKDVDEVRKALVDRGNYEPDDVPKLFNKTHDELANEIGKFFDQQHKGDLVLVYFSGHGHRTADGKLYLVPTDFDMAHADATGIDVAKLQATVAGCRATNKVVIIDACHAGTAPASDIKKVFDQAENVYTLASSRDKEESQEWPQMHQSLFTYWLVQGLKGHAAHKSRGEVSIDDIWNFVSNNVRATLEHKCFNGATEQTPARHILEGTGTPTLTKLKAMPLKVIADDIAEQIRWAIQFQFGVQGVEVAIYPRFAMAQIDETGSQKTLGNRYGSIPDGCARVLQSSLQDQAKGFTVVAKGETREALRKALAKGSAAKQKLPALAAALNKDPSNTVEVQGWVDSVESNVVDIHAEARQSDTGAAILCQAGGRVDLTMDSNGQSCDETALMGSSGVFTQEDYKPTRDPDTGEERSRQASAIFSLEKDPLRMNTHPLSPTYKGEELPFKLSIHLRDKTKPDEEAYQSEPEPMYFEGNDAYVGLDKDDEYVVQVDYECSDFVHMKLMVDGVSTRNHEAPGQAGVFAANVNLPAQKGARKSGSKGRNLHPLTKDASMDFIDSSEPGMLSESTAWVLVPKESTCRIPGFFIADPDGVHHSNGRYYRFVVANSAESIGADRGYTDQIGMITAVFYKDNPGTRGAVGTKAGEVVNGPSVRQVTDEIGIPGDEIARVTIHYVSRQELESLKQKNE